MTIRVIRTEFEIDAEDKTYGNCRERTRGWCNAFDDALTYASEPHEDDFLRNATCRAAEAKDEEVGDDG